MKRSLALVVLFALFACRTGRPAGGEVPPLNATSVEDARQQLRERRANFRGMSSLMRVRATRNRQTQSFRAHLTVHDARRMEMTVFTPLGTAALVMKADGDVITSTPPVPPSSFDFLRTSGLTPAEVGMLLLGLPPRDGLDIDYAPTGIAGARSEDISVTFDPAAFPEKRVVVTRGSDRVEIEHIEVTQ